MSGTEQRFCIPCGKPAEQDDLTCAACGEASWGPPLTLNSSPDDADLDPGPDADSGSSPSRKRRK